MMMNEQGEIYLYKDGRTISETLEYADSLTQEKLQKIKERSQISDEERRKLLKDYTFDEFRNFAPVVNSDNMDG